MPALDRACLSALTDHFSTGGTEGLATEEEGDE